MDSQFKKERVLPKQWSFIQLSDIHIGSKDSFRFRPAWVANFENAIEQIKAFETQPEFIVISGDLTRDGKTEDVQLRAVKERLEKLPWPIHTIPGNHDLGHRYHPKKKSTLCEQMLTRYRSIFGTDRFSFKHGDIQLVGFNSQILSSGFKEEEEQWTWLEQQTHASGRHIWFMHSAPFKRTPDEEDTDFDGEFFSIVGRTAIQRIVKLMKRCDAQFLSYGHVHVYYDQLEDGIHYVGCPATAFRLKGEFFRGEKDWGFLEWRITPDSITPIYRKLNEISTLEGWGSNPEL